MRSLDVAAAAKQPISLSAWKISEINNSSASACIAAVDVNTTLTPEA